MELSRIQPLTPLSGLAALSARRPMLHDRRPDIPVTDVILEHDELAMASHSRGFWALDNIGPLRQREPGTLDGDLVLFEPATAYGSANGVVLSWWAGEGRGSATEARLEILDASGAIVRTSDPSVEGEDRDRWSGPALPVAVGWNRLRWDLRTDPAATFSGMILWVVRTMAPTVPPGTYGVRLTVGDAVATSEVVVERHSWIDGVTAEDLGAQYEFGARIRDQVERANRVVIAIRDVEAELQKRLAILIPRKTLGTSVLTNKRLASTIRRPHAISIAQEKGRTLQ